MRYAITNLSFLSHSALFLGSHLFRFLSQHVLLNLPRRSLRKLRLKHHRFRHHIVRHLRPAILHYLPLRRLLLQPILQAHERTRRLPPELVRPRHHRRLVHRRVPVQHRFHLHAAQILAAADYHVLRSIFDLQIPVRMHHSHIPRVEPPVLEALGVRLWILQVTQHHASAPRAFSVAGRRFHCGFHAHETINPPVSVSPYPWPTTNPNASVRSSTAAGGGAPAHVEHHGGPTHVSDTVALDQTVHDGGVEFTDADVVDEDELGFGVAEDDGDGAGVEAGVDVVEDGAGERDGEVELVHGGDVGGDDGDDVAAADPDGGEGGGELEASAMGLGPSERGVVVDDGGAVAVDGGCSVEEA
ncbi:Uncharacterized protein G2W53_013522 [Senna tora]|uniref:Uncharacterized protein n=1 Tax=Senna tora TaxID=362788 RepID=A0A834TZV8_9FABA|nr:Uncharacterized protein G2W53_013522 [Senna tora]